MTHIVYQSYRKEFDEIEIGEFFADGGGLYFKIDSERAYSFSGKEIVSFNSWDDITEVEATITAKF